MQCEGMRRQNQRPARGSFRSRIAAEATSRTLRPLTAFVPANPRGVRFARRPPPSPQQVREALQAYTSEAYTIGCPSAPRHTVFVHEEADRPQPRLDRDYQLGAGVSVGRVRQCRVLDIKFVVLANNVAIGAATSSIINAEYAVLKGIVSA